MSPMDAKQRAWRVAVAHKPDPIVDAIAREIDDALDEYKATVVSKLQEDLEGTKKDYARLQELAGEAVGTLKMVSVRLPQLAQSSRELDMVHAKLFEICRSVEKANGTIFVGANVSDGKYMQITPREMEKWLDQLGYVLKSLEELAPERGPVSQRVCETCNLEGLGPCVGCGPDHVKWTPKQIGKGG